MRITFIICLILFINLTFAQKGKSILILKDGTQINGFGEISGIQSIVSVKFKNDTLKYRTYKSKEIIGIDILENNYYRQFRYKYIDGDKFPDIMEIVSIDSLSLYVRVYEEVALSNSLLNYPRSINQYQPTLVELENGQKVDVVPIRNIYIEINFPRYSYYVGAGESNQVEHLYTKGLPFSKSFKKSIKKYFKSCSSLIEKVENKEFSKDEILEVVEYYNRTCLNSKGE